MKKVICFCLFAVIIFQKASYAQSASNEISLDEQQTIYKEENVKEVAPVIADAMSNMLSEIFNFMAPVLIAIEENKKLIKANDEMAEKIKNAIKSPYNETTSYVIDVDTNAIEFDGSYEKNNTLLRYRIVRNLSNAVIVDDIIKKEGLAAGITDNFSQIAKENTTVTNLDDEQIDMKRIKINKINNHDFAGYSSKKDNQIFLFTNIGSYITLQIQVQGDIFGDLAKEFIYSLDYDALKEAVSDDGRKIEDIKIMIDNISKDSSKIDELFEKQN